LSSFVFLSEHPLAFFSTLAFPLFDLAPTVAPLNVAARVCRRQDQPFYFTFTFLDLLLSYLSRNRVSQPYKYPCARLAEQQAIAAPFPISFSCAFFLSLLLCPIRLDAVRCQPTTPRTTPYPQAVARLTTANPPPPSRSVAHPRFGRALVLFLFPLLLRTHARTIGLRYTLYQMPAPVRPASSHQVPVSSPKSSEPASSPLATPFPFAQSLQRDSPGDHTAMSHSITPAEIQLNEQELYEFVDESSRWRMKDKDDITKYTAVFWYLCDPLVACHYMSLGECEELFLPGFHPDISAQFPPDVKQQFRDILQRPLPQFAAHRSEVLPAPSPVPETSTLHGPRC